MTGAKSYDVAIVGGGPAGLSAAVLLGRCRRRVILLDQGNPRNKVARAVNGYLGLEGVPPEKLRTLGRAQAEQYGVEFVDAEVTGVEALEDKPHGFELTDAHGNVYRARKLLLATGVIDRLPEIDGMAEFYGTSVHHCPYCDGWEHRDQHLVAVGDNKTAVSLARSLRTWSPNITACSNGSSLSEKRIKALQAADIQHISLSIERLEGEGGSLKRIVFEDGSTLECDAIFFSDTQYQRSQLAERLGCNTTPRGHVESEGKQESTVPGLFLAGDADGYIQFAIVAAAEGAIAATAINQELQKADLADNARTGKSLA